MLVARWNETSRLYEWKNKKLSSIFPAVIGMTGAMNHKIIRTLETQQLHPVDAFFVH